VVLTWLAAKVKFSVGSETFEEHVPIPQGRVRPRDLVDAPHWAATHPIEPDPKPAFDLVRELIDLLKRTG